MNEFRIRGFLLHFLKHHLVLLLLLAIAILGEALSGLLPPFMLRFVIDNFIQPSLASAAPASGKIALLVTLYFGSYFLVGVFTVFESFMISLFGQKMIHELRYEMMKKTHRMKTSYFTTHGTGEMHSQVMDDVYSIETLFATGIVSILVSLIKIIGIIVSVFTFSWMLGLIIFALLPVIFLITSSFRKSMLRNQMKNRKLINALSNSLSESIDASRTIHNLDQEQYREDEFAVLLGRSFQARDQSSWFDAVYSPIIDLIKALLISAVTLLVCYGSGHADFLSLGISVGTYAASLTLISNIFSPITEIGQELEAMQEGVSGVKRVQQFMNEPEIESKDPSYTCERLWENPPEHLIEIKDMSFRYDDGTENVFTNATFVIYQEERVTLVGRTGVGKTTLFKLILGLVSPTSGKILINGFDATKIPDGEKRRIFGYVEQGFRSVPGTIEEQITLKDPSITASQVERVMKAVFLDEYVNASIKGGYQAEFQESDFSRGQLQLLSLARALVVDPKILLLDEISANLDSKTEKQITEALGAASKQRTVISISHRLSDQLGFQRTIELK